MKLIEERTYEERLYIYSDDIEARKHFVSELEPKGWMVDNCWVGIDLNQIKQFYRFKRELTDDYVFNR
ncbi:hypothetical protein [Bacillus subtilis]|uniref:Uncharacterized protein n=1 Tax=Bacillus subtilis (strain 168) TaxID=224308 RepID=A0A6M4JRL6_BACSU|nr:hypothetical protein [Bacillus subtilis]QJF45424.1 hypothetical protein HIR76_16365 [Bacillus subtilis subsp. subtilis str. 168]QJP90864.1 hypothetical protein HIR78_11110 [Bacillus subtilis subsp. subtilis str. 168]QJR48735.1 hypothetical protein HIR77_11085 [Bacillus subtilis subsp. subtilis str. 168]TXK64174.1 hypothetical protein FVD40_06160 [Bacillus subtilis]WVM74376.1 hypothetical protein V0Q53_04960 [Bacillus subtilis]